MPQLRLYSPPLSLELKRQIAKSLTDLVVRLMSPEKASAAGQAQVRARTTLELSARQPADFAIGGVLAADSGEADYLLELADWGLSAGRQRRLAHELTALLAELTGQRELGRISVRFLPYAARDFAVAGKLVKDRVPRLARIAKRVSR